MSAQREAMGPHDVGGDFNETRAIDTVDHGMTHWEQHANALRMVITGKDLGTLDEMRRAAEDLGQRYNEIGYFEKQTEAFVIVMIERGVVTREEVDGKIEEIAARFDVPTIPLPEVKADGHSHDHDHDHDHDHPVYKEDDTGGRPNEHHLMNLAMQDLLIAQGRITADEVRQMIERFDADFPKRGAKVVAKAWADPEFKARLLADACPTIEAEMGFDEPFQAGLIAVENTQDVHNVIVCTLCSCYPRYLLGQPPTWYKSRAYRSRMVHEPRTVLKEFGTEIADDVKIRVHDSNADMRYFVIPMQPKGTEGWSEEQLEAIINRDSLVGITLPKA